MGFDWKGLLGTVAPTLATALGGPLAGAATRALSTALLGKETGKESEIAAALQGASPEALLKLKEADNAFETRMAELGVDLERIATDDRKNARQMAEKNGQVPQIVLSVIYTLAYALVLWSYVTGEVNVAPNAETQFSIVLGVLTAAQTQVLNFWLGSSAGSKQKTEAMARGKA